MTDIRRHEDHARTSAPPSHETDEERLERINAEANRADHDNQCAKDLED